MTVQKSNPALPPSFEPSGAMVGALRDSLRSYPGLEIPAGAAHIALMAALMAEHERRDHEESAGNASDPRSAS